MITLPWARVLFLGVLLAWTAPTQAAGNSAELQALQDNAYAAVTQRMMYVVLDRDPGRKAATEMRLKAADIAVAGLADATLAQKWRAVRAAVTSDPYAEGEVNPFAIYDMENRVTEFAGEIQARMPPDTSSSRQALHELVGLLQGMMTIYLRNSADPRGGSGYVGVNQDIDLATQQQKFNAKMAALAKSDPPLFRAMNKSTVKWRFLSGHFADFNRQSVPYVADLFGRQIIDELLALAAAQH